MPVTAELYWGNVHTQEAFYQKAGGEISALPHKESRTQRWIVEKGHKASSGGSSDETVKIVCSRSHMNDETLKFIEQFKGNDEVPMGSSLKFLKIAEGAADIYPRFGPTMEWDTAAAHGVLSACGYSIKNTENYAELIYNKPNLLNPHFMAF